MHPADAAVAYIRRHGRLTELDRDPDFEGADERSRSVVGGERLANYFRSQYFNEDEIALLCGQVATAAPPARIVLPSIDEGGLARLAQRELPDSAEYAVIDIGSGFARDTTRPLAAAKPSVRVYMVDRIEREWLDQDWQYIELKYPGAGPPLRTRVPFSRDIATTVNILFRVNGYTNITYVHKCLTPEDSTLGIEDELAGKRVVVTGYKNPKGLGNLTAALAIKLRAEALYLNNSALEKLPKDAPAFGPMRSLLRDRGLSAAEADGVCARISDPRFRPDRPDYWPKPEKYEYSDPAQRQFGETLKLPFVLVQAQHLERNGYAVTVLQEPGERRSYNGPDHHLVARRRSR